MKPSSNKLYRSQSTRLQTWDYSWDGAYFVTICSRDKRCYFGEISQAEMHLSQLGKIADQYWLDIPSHAKNVILGEHMVMPNHLHGILILEGNNRIIENNHNDYCASTRFQHPGKNSISTIIGGYKSAVMKEANRLKLTFGWQPKFHDHIIRDDKSFQTISEYIRSNPQNWHKDTLFASASKYSSNR